jgi:hypothetical protein
MLENMKDDDYDDEFPSTPVELVSKCCGASSITELYETKLGNVVGTCSTCKERTTFKLEIEDER